MRLVEQGKVDLDADVNQYLNGFQLPNTYQRPITLRSIYMAWRKRTALAIGAGVILASYIPFVIYWNLHA